jgi:hypothetical protein
MLRTPPLALLAAFALAACAENPTRPDVDYEPPVEQASQDYSVYDPGWKIDLPPLQVKPTFWTCAAQAEGIFVDAVAQILVLETRALQEPDPVRQAVLFAEVNRRKHEAKKALYFALEQCVATYGAPLLFALPDENGNLVFQPFSVAVYHAYLVEKHLERS